MGDLNEPKKETVRITLPPPPSGLAENGGEPNETVRITLPARSSSASAAPQPPKHALPPQPAASSNPVVRPPVPTPSGTAVRPPTFRPPPVPSKPGTRPPAPPVLSGAAGEAALAHALQPPPPPVMPPRPRVLPPPPRVISPAKASSSVAPAPSTYPGSGHAGPKKETARISILPEPVASPAPAVKMAKTQPLMPAPAAKVYSAPVKTITPTPSAKPAAGPSILDALEFVPIPIAALICGISGVTLLIQIWNYFGS